MRSAADSFDQFLPIDSVVTDIPGGGAETPDFNTVPITCLHRVGNPKGVGFNYADVHWVPNSGWIMKASGSKLGSNSTLVISTIL